MKVQLFVSQLSVLVYKNLRSKWLSKKSILADFLGLLVTACVLIGFFAANLAISSADGIPLLSRTRSLFSFIDVNSKLMYAPNGSGRMTFLLPQLIEKDTDRVMQHIFPNSSFYIGFSSEQQMLDFYSGKIKDRISYSFNGRKSRQRYILRGGLFERNKWRIK